MVRLLVSLGLLFSTASGGASPPSPSWTAPTSTSIFFANITEWGPTAQRFITEKYYQTSVVGLVETHKGADELEAIEANLFKDGWLMHATAARPSGRSESGLSGGEWMLSRPHVAATSFTRMRNTMRAHGRTDPCKGFAPLTLHLKRGNVVAISAYLMSFAPVDGSVSSGLVLTFLTARSLATRARADSTTMWCLRTPALPYLYDLSLRYHGRRTVPSW